MGKIGGETERTTRHHRNGDIDDERTPLNLYFKKSDGGLRAQWKRTLEELHASYKKTKKSVAFEGMIIASDTEFFERLGWEKGKEAPPGIIEFFERCYRFALDEIGYKGTDQNILSAVVHFDETTPHLQLYYIPVVDQWKEKVYAHDEEGKVKRNEKGSPIQARDHNGKLMTKVVCSPDQPKVCSSDFWAERGGQTSFGNLQDDFHEFVGYRYGLDRGEVGSNKKHTTKYEWEKKQQEKELKANGYSLEVVKTELALARRNTEAEREKAEKEREKAEKALTERKTAEQANAKLAADNEQLNAENRRLTEQAEPLREYLAAFEEALNGDLPLSPVKLRKMVVGLTAKYKELEAEKKIGERDKEYLFKELREAEQRIPELERYREFVSLLHTYAPDELDTAKRAALDRRDAPYKNPRTNGKSGNFK